MSETCPRNADRDPTNDPCADLSRTVEHRAGWKSLEEVQTLTGQERRDAFLPNQHRRIVHEADPAPGQPEIEPAREPEREAGENEPKRGPEIEPAESPHIDPSVSPEVTPQPSPSIPELARRR